MVTHVVSRSWTTKHGKCPSGMQSPMEFEKKFVSLFWYGMYALKEKNYALKQQLLVKEWTNRGFGKIVVQDPHFWCQCLRSPTQKERETRS